MALFKKISDDMKAAMKSGDKPRLEVLRFTLAGLNAAQKEKALKDPQAMLSDEEGDIKVLYEYLPQELSRDEIVAIVKDLKAKGVASDFSGLMKETMKIAKGRADGKTVGDVIRDVERA